MQDDVECGLPRQGGKVGLLKELFRIWWVFRYRRGWFSWMAYMLCLLPATYILSRESWTDPDKFHHLPFFIVWCKGIVSLFLSPWFFLLVFSPVFFLLLVFLPVCSHHLKKVACFCRSWINIITQSWVCLNSHQYGKHEHTYTHSSVRTVLSSSTKSYKFMMTGCEFKRERDTNFFFFCTVKSTMASRRNRLESGALLWLL